MIGRDNKASRLDYCKLGCGYYLACGYCLFWGIYFIYFLFVYFLTWKRMARGTWTRRTG